MKNTVADKWLRDRGIVLSPGFAETLRSLVLEHKKTGECR